MDFNTTIDLIIKDLNEASEIIDDLKKYPGVPALQVELAKSKCRSAGDVIALLKSLGDVIPVKTAKVQEKVKEPETKKSEITASEKTEITATEKTEVTVSETFILADKFTSSSDLYEEQSANKKVERDLSDHLKVKSITKLSDAIGISDKFLFMGEIFNGNKEAYAQAIARLDKAETIEDASAIILSYTGQNTENEAVVQLLELVKLKLSANE
jgi:hypothetical protein